MQKKSRISFGPGAASIILIVVILSMSVLGLLSLVNAKNDRHLSDRSAEVVEAVYTLDAQAERKFAQLDVLVVKAAGEAGGDLDQLLNILSTQVPEGVTLEGDRFTWTESDELRDLECAAQISLDGDESSLTWAMHRMTMRTEDTWNLVNF